MARKKKSTARRSLILAFVAGALTASAGVLTLQRRRQEGDFPTSGAVGHLTETAVPPLTGGHFDSSSQDSMSMPAAEHG